MPAVPAEPLQRRDVGLVDRSAVGKAGDRPFDAVFAQRIADAARQNPKTEVQLRADKGVPYGRVAEVIGMVQKAGLNRIGFVTEPAAATPP